MTYRVFGDLRSGAFSAEAALAEAGAPYEFQRISLAKNEQREPAFLAVNPSGKVPALKLPEGAIVTESAAILLTIADHFPNAKLLPPQGTVARAQAYRWLAFMASEIYPMVEISDYPQRFAPEGAQAAALRARVEERIRDRLLIVERNVAEPWLLPGGFSILDIYAAMFTRWHDSVGQEWLDDDNIPKLKAIAKSLSERPAVTPVWRRHFG
jgi:GST-like protein